MTSVSDSYVRSQYFNDQFSKNRIIRDLDEGLTALRGTKDIISSVTSETMYLPRFPNEPDEFYQLRVNRTYLTNYYKRAITSDAGKILANNVMVSIDGKPNDSMPDPYRSWVRNMNLDGDNLTMFTQSELQMAMQKGVVLCMVDFDESAQRPYTREIDIDSVIDFVSDGKTGKLTYLKFYFDYVVSGETSTDIQQAVFELTPVAWTITIGDEGEQVESGEIIRYRNNGKERIVDEIPVAVFYTNKKGVLKAESPYQTLAELTIEHFQVYSDIKNMMFYALTPILTATNAPSDFSIEMLASYMFVKMPESGDKAPELKWTQVDSAAIVEGQKQLEGIQQRIATFTIDNNSLRPGNLTATQTSIESQGSNAALRSFAVALSEHVRDVLELMESYALIPNADIKGYIAPEFNALESDKEMRTLLEMRRNKDLSRETIVDAAVQRKLLSPDFDSEKNDAEVETEIAEELKREQSMEELKQKGKEKQNLLAGDGEKEITDKPKDT